MEFIFKVEDNTVGWFLHETKMKDFTQVVGSALDSLETILKQRNNGNAVVFLKQLENKKVRIDDLDEPVKSLDLNSILEERMKEKQND